MTVAGLLLFAVAVAICVAMSFEDDEFGDTVGTSITKQGGDGQKK